MATGDEDERFQEAVARGVAEGLKRVEADKKAKTDKAERTKEFRTVAFLAVAILVAVGICSRDVQKTRATKDERLVYVTVPVANLRAGAGKDHAVVSQANLAQGLKRDESRDDGEWRAVNNPGRAGERTVWIHSSLIGTKADIASAKERRETKQWCSAMDREMSHATIVYKYGTGSVFIHDYAWRLLPIDLKKGFQRYFLRCKGITQLLSASDGRELAGIGWTGARINP